MTELALTKPFTICRHPAAKSKQVESPSIFLPHTAPSFWNSQGGCKAGGHVVLSPQCSRPGCRRSSRRSSWRAALRRRRVFIGSACPQSHDTEWLGAADSGTAARRHGGGVLCPVTFDEPVVGEIPGDTTAHPAQCAAASHSDPQEARRAAVCSRFYPAPPRCSCQGVAAHMTPLEEVYAGIGTWSCPEKVASTT